MTERQGMTESDETAAAAAAVRAGDESAFNSLAKQHRGELLVHCYRMLGSLHDAEDAVQETFTRAWQYRESFKGDASLRAWLYRIATNTSLDVIARDRRRAELAGIANDDSSRDPKALAEVTWLQPIPDALLGPDAVVLTKETIELAFLTLIQLLTPQQRAALLLRDVLGWSAKETAELLEVSVAAANSALQRARATLQAHLPARRAEWPAGVEATAAERELLRKYIEATETPDLSAFASIIRDDAIFRMPPDPRVLVGREPMIRFWAEGGFGSEDFGRIRCAVTRANRQPAVANYLLAKGDSVYRAMTLDVLRIEEGMITEIVTFAPDLFHAFGLPQVLQTP
ncbi:MAG TPA: RNA polymerase subunit sigma-70 [Myxococcaceae bacterium]|nr:RNA polymerase subunit sigma-70 [Myxococcaceae bacterium]